MRKLWNVVWKELLEMARDPKFIAGFAISFLMFAVMGHVVGASLKETFAGSYSVAVLDLDRGAWASRIIEEMRANATVVKVSGSLEGALREAVSRGVQALVVIPPGFSANISRGVRGYVKVYFISNGTTMMAVTSSMKVEDLISSVSRKLSDEFISARVKGVSPDFLQNPIASRSALVLKGRVIEASPGLVMGILAGQSFALPWIIFMLVIFTAQFAVTSMAIEKEAKTLEMLMTQPVSRLTILAGKLVASVILALAGTLVFSLGYGYYMSSMFASMPSEEGEVSVGAGLGALSALAKAGLLPTPLSAAMLLAVIALSMISALALALMLGAFAEDVRGAQSLLGIVITIFVLPFVALMFVDPDTLPLAPRLALLAIPYSHTVIATRAAFFNDYAALATALAYLAAFTVALLCATAKLFTTEALFTLRLRRRERARAL